jgi:hypothetical protein
MRIGRNASNPVRNRVPPRRRAGEIADKSSSIVIATQKGAALFTFERQSTLMTLLAGCRFFHMVRYNRSVLFVVGLVPVQATFPRVMAFWLRGMQLRMPKAVIVTLQPPA